MTDLELQHAVMEEIKSNFIVHPNEIGVAVHQGVVTLSGFVDSFLEKTMAEVAAKRVAGVRAVVEEIKLRSQMQTVRTDEEIATAVSNALSGYLGLPEGQIKITVESGRVTLDGNVNSESQKEMATDAIKYIIGIRSIDNFLFVNAE
ncbi:MAG: BON domain-containing protein [Flavipsychrobacter sp.]